MPPYLTVLTRDYNRGYYNPIRTDSIRGNILFMDSVTERYVPMKPIRTGSMYIYDKIGTPSRPKYVYTT